MENYHGILINLSIKDKTLLRSLETTGKKNVFLNLLVLYKINAAPEKIEGLIASLQAALVERFWFYFPHFYFHFYRNDELIVVFKEKVFRTSTDPSRWTEAIAYGKSLGIPENQLDFFPCRVEDETY